MPDSTIIAVNKPSLAPQQPESVYSTQAGKYDISVPRLLQASALAELIAGETVLIKPNLVEALAPPITTPVALIAAIIEFLQQAAPQSRIIIGEGTGSLDYPTSHCFDTLGYTEMAAGYGVDCIDLNTADLIRKNRPDCRRWPEIYLPAILDEVFLISVPVLKAHSLSGVTLTMKNMMGCAPPEHYQAGGCWGKSAFHCRIHEAIADLNRYRTPDFTLLDGTTGMSKAHLWGPHCDPPVDRLAASRDPVAIDSYGCELLGRDYRLIGHIQMAHNELGYAEPLEVITI